MRKMNILKFFNYRKFKLNFNFKEFNNFIKKLPWWTKKIYSNLFILIQKEGWKQSILWWNKYLPYSLLIQKKDYHKMKIQINEILFNKSLISSNWIQYFFKV